MGPRTVPNPPPNAKPSPHIPARFQKENGPVGTEPFCGEKDLLPAALWTPRTLGVSDRIIPTQAAAPKVARILTRIHVEVRWIIIGPDAPIGDTNDARLGVAAAPLTGYDETPVRPP